MKQKNNHARSKQKRKKLRMKNKMRSIIEKRIQKIEREKKPKGKTIVGNATAHAIDLTNLEYREAIRIAGSNKGIFRNQRQKRKQRRNNPSLYILQ